MNIANIVAQLKGAFGFVTSKRDPVTGKVENLTSGARDVVADLGLDAAGGYIFQKPAHIEQFISGMFGRGMLTSEVIGVATEQYFTEISFAAGTTVHVSDTSHYQVGGCCMIKYPSTKMYPNGRYMPHFVASKTANSLGIRPGLYADIGMNSSIERLWFNRSHPGKYYMRYLAQRIAYGTELHAAITPRIALIDYHDSAPEHLLTGVGNALIYYYDFANTGSSGDVGSPVRFCAAKNAYIENLLAVGDGVKTAAIALAGKSFLTVSVLLYVSSATATYKISVVDQSGDVLGETSVPAGIGVLSRYSVICNAADATQITVQITCTSNPGGNIVIGRIEIFEAPATIGRVISNPRAVIVVDGDSWGSGDIINTIEREPISKQLSLELPNATVENKAVGGSTLIDILARFDASAADVLAKHGRIDYWVVNTGTNEAYNPFSATFSPNAVLAFKAAYRKLITRIFSVGARPIIIGVPGLAQTDSETPLLGEWELNNRARSYVLDGQI